MTSEQEKWKHVKDVSAVPISNKTYDHFLLKVVVWLETCTQHKVMNSDIEQEKGKHVKAVSAIPVSNKTYDHLLLKVVGWLEICTQHKVMKSNID